MDRNALFYFFFAFVALAREALMVMPSVKTENVVVTVVTKSRSLKAQRRKFGRAGAIDALRSVRLEPPLPSFFCLTEVPRH